MNNKESTSVQLDMIRDHSIPSTLETGLTILFGLKGRYTFSTAKTSSVIREGCLAAVAPMRVYGVSGKKNSALLRIRIDQSVLRLAGCDLRLTLNCILSGENNDQKSRHLKELCAALFRAYLEKNSRTEIRARSMELASWLYEHFSYETSSDQMFTTQNLERLEHVLDELKTNWKNPLSLHQIARNHFISESYLSRLFHRYTGYRYLECLTEIRLGYALEELRYTDKTITDIALDNGFGNTNAFITHFKNKYQMTPGIYRKQFLELDLSATDPQPYPELADLVKPLLQYDSSGMQSKAVSKSVNASVILQDGREVISSWKEILNIGYAVSLLMAPVQKQVRRIQKEIGFHYFRIKGILDDDLHVYYENEDGSPVCNFNYVDQVTDFVLDCGGVPYFELSWFPPKLASRQVYFWDNHCIIAPPEDFEKWKAFLKELILHWIKRYGMEQVRKWRFTPITYVATEMWPDLWDYDKYLSLCIATYDALKSVSEDLQIGGYGFFPDTALDSQKGFRLLDDLRARNRLPDFLTIRCYSHDIAIQDESFVALSANQSQAPSIVSADPQFIQHFLEQYHALLEEKDYGSLPVMLEACMVSLWQQDLSGDTLFRAAWYCKNILENLDNASAFGFAIATDWLNEVHIPGSAYHGEQGMITISGIAKSAFHLFRMLTKLGTHHIQNEPGYYVARDESSVQIMFYHYCHYEDLYRMRYKKLENPHDAYDVFQNEGPAHFQISLQNLEPGQYQIRTESLTRTHGSSFDEWLRMNAPQELSREEAEFLDSISKPKITIQQVVLDGKITVEADLASHEIQLVVLTKL